MADIKLPESIPCQFDKNGWGSCKTPTDNGWCSEHEHLRCVSCGAKATESCDAQMGGLCCGAPLCDTCEHEGGKHVTKKVAEEKRQAEQMEKEAQIASRKSSVQRMNMTLGVPCNLFELLKGDWQKDGYQLMKVYCLHLKHGMIGFFPAIFCSDKQRMVFTMGLPILQKVWVTLEPREAVIATLTAYVNLGLGIGYIDPPDVMDREEKKPFKILTEVEFNDLTGKEEAPFAWAFGLIGLGKNKEDYLRDFIKQAQTINPSF